MRRSSTRTRVVSPARGRRPRRTSVVDEVERPLRWADSTQRPGRGMRTAPRCRSIIGMTNVRLHEHHLPPPPHDDSAEAYVSGDGGAVRGGWRRRRPRRRRRRSLPRLRVGVGVGVGVGVQVRRFALEFPGRDSLGNARGWGWAAARGRGLPAARRAASSWRRRHRRSGTCAGVGRGCLSTTTGERQLTAARPRTRPLGLEARGSVATAWAANALARRRPTVRERENWYGLSPVGS